MGTNPDHLRTVDEADLDAIRLSAALLLPVRADELGDFMALIARPSSETEVPETQGVEQS